LPLPEEIFFATIHTAFKQMFLLYWTEIAPTKNLATNNTLIIAQAQACNDPSGE